MSRKLIGLTGPSAFTTECVDMIEQFYDADFVMLYHNNEETLMQWVEKCDGICLAGGVDIHPSVYDHSIWNGQGYTKFDLKRDERELKIINHCKKTKKPMLCICRGHQLLGISYGFFLIPDLASSSICHQPQRAQISVEKNEPVHAVSIVDTDKYFRVFSGRNPKERMPFKRLMGYDQNAKLWTNSFHHQGLAFPQSKKNWPDGASGINIYGTARVDLTHIKVEKIIELMGTDDWVSCQWHPEFDWMCNSASRAVLERFKTILNKSNKQEEIKDEVRVLASSISEIDAIQEEGHHVEGEEIFK